MTTSLTRQLDALARQHGISPADAALVLHATSGRVEAAQRHLGGGGSGGGGTSSSLPTFSPVWLPRDDAHLLSAAMSVSSLEALRRLEVKFGREEMARRLVYLSDTSSIPF